MRDLLKEDENVKKLLLILGFSILLVGCSREPKMQKVEVEYIGQTVVDNRTVVQFNNKGKELNLYWINGGIPMTEGKRYKITYHDDEDYRNRNTVMDVETIDGKNF